MTMIDRHGARDTAEPRTAVPPEGGSGPASPPRRTRPVVSRQSASATRSAAVRPTMTPSRILALGGSVAALFGLVALMGHARSAALDATAGTATQTVPAPTTSAPAAPTPSTPPPVPVIQVIVVGPDGNPIGAAQAADAATAPAAAEAAPALPAPVVTDAVPPAPVIQAAPAAAPAAASSGGSR